MRLIIDTSLWLQGDAELPDDVKSNDALMETLLRAVEELSPTDGESVVSLAPIGRNAPTAEFTADKRERARKMRVEIRLRNSETSRPIDLVGRIAKLDAAGWLTLRDVAPRDDWKGATARCSFNVGDLLPTILENFGRVVRLSAVQKKTPRGWSKTPEAIDIVREVQAIEHNEQQQAPAGPKRPNSSERSPK